MEVRYFVEKKNIYDAHIFTRSLVQTCSLESTSLFLHTRLRVNKKFPNSHYFFFEININVWMLYSQIVITSIILHSRRPNCQKKSVMHLVFMFPLIFFRILRSWKARFSHRSISPPRYVLKRFRYLEVINRVRKWNKVKNVIFVGSKLQLSQLEIPIFIYKIMCQSTLINSVSLLFCGFIRVTSWNDGKTIILVRSSFQIPKEKYWFQIQGQPMSM